MPINDESNDRQPNLTGVVGSNAHESDRGAASRRADAGRGNGARSDGTGARSSQSGRSARGFAAMDPSQQRRIASEGGRAAHQSGHAHEFDSREAREAGRKGGEAVSRNREHMSAIGRRGAEVRNQERGGGRTGRGASSGGSLGPMGSGAGEGVR